MIASCYFRPHRKEFTLNNILAHYDKTQLLRTQRVVEILGVSW